MTKDLQLFSVGDTVQWTSTSNSVTTTKRGEVVRVVTAGVIPSFDDLMHKYGARSNYGGGLSRPNQSYVVLVRPAKGKAKPVLYWPNERKLIPATKEPA